MSINKTIGIGNLIVGIVGIIAANVMFYTCDKNTAIFGLVLSFLCIFIGYKLYEGETK